MKIPVLKWSVKNSRIFPEGIFAAKELGIFAREFNPDVIHSFSRIFYLLGTFFAKYPLIMSYQRHPTQRSIRLANKIFAKRIQFTGCSEYISQLGRKGGGQWSCIYNGVEVEKYHFSEKVSHDAPLVFLSRIEPIKGAHLAIKIAKQSSRRLLLAGNCEKERAGSSYWKNEIEPYLDGKQIQYIGPVDDIQKNELLKEASALLVPVQWNEPFGIVFAEALACGTPVISCPRGALPEIIINDFNGYLIKDIDEGVTAVRKLKNIERKLCRKVACEKFSSKVLVSKYEELYRKIYHHGNK